MIFEHYFRRNPKTDETQTNNASKWPTPSRSQSPDMFVNFDERPRRSNRTNRKGAWSYSIRLAGAGYKTYMYQHNQRTRDND